MGRVPCSPATHGPWLGAAVVAEAVLPGHSPCEAAVLPEGKKERRKMQEREFRANLDSQVAIREQRRQVTKQQDQVYSGMKDKELEQWQADQKTELMRVQTKRRDNVAIIDQQCRQKRQQRERERKREAVEGTRERAVFASEAAPDPSIVKEQRHRLKVMMEDQFHQYHSHRSEVKKTEALENDKASKTWDSLIANRMHNRQAAREAMLAKQRAFASKGEHFIIEAARPIIPDAVLDAQYLAERDARVSAEVAAEKAAGQARRKRQEQVNEVNDTVASSRAKSLTERRNDQRVRDKAFAIAEDEVAEARTRSERESQRAKNVAHQLELAEQIAAKQRAKTQTPAARPPAPGRPGV